MARGTVYECKEPTCKQVIVGRAAFTLHKREHTLEKPYACRKPNCGKRYTQKKQLTKHMRAHAAEDTHERVKANGGEKVEPEATPESHTAEKDNKPDSSNASGSPGSPGPSINPIFDVSADLQKQLYAANGEINQLKEKCARLEADNEKCVEANASYRKCVDDAMKLFSSVSGNDNY